ncbi:MAG TPA: heme-binding domain-containing protein [Anaerolineales bacterium]|nr:heme-binding domain-containing protein [Anaerolineales bacterium]
MKRIIIYLIIAALIIFGLIQLLPIGKNHVNPATVSEPNWDNTATRDLAVEHCFQCHSNETEWTWYSNIAPASWLIYSDVVNGRRSMNFSDWNNRPQSLDELVEVIQSGEMPPIQYWIFHPGSRLTPEQKQIFIDGLTKTINP